MLLEGYGSPYWLEIERPNFPRLEGTRTADVAIVGAGIAGLKLAHHCASRGLTVAVCEGGRVGDGASGRNQGTINHGPNMPYGACVRRHGRDTARDLWRLGLENHCRVRELIAEYDIRCGYERLGEHFLARRDHPACAEDLAQLREDFELLREDGFEVSWLDEALATEVGGSPLFVGGLRYGADAQFHPGKFVAGLANGVGRRAGVRLFEHSRVLGIRAADGAVHVRTACGEVVARDVFLALNALAPQFVRSLERSLRAERGQVLLTEPLPVRPCAGSFDTRMAWWRDVPEADGRYRLLFGGGRAREAPDSLFPQYDRRGRPHPQLEREGFSPSRQHQERLESQLSAIFPAFAKAAITHRWGGLQSFTADTLPVVGLFDPERRIHGVAGFCGRGNCHSDVAAEYLAGKVIGTESPIERSYGSLLGQLMRVGRESAEWGPWVSAYD
jgi:gamma-glutamylputrescine oxidase